MTPYIGEILAVGFNFAPPGWQMCDGSLLQISENEALFNLLGTTYGGDGQMTFGLPDLRGRTPIHVGTGPGLSGYALGQQGGSEMVTLNTSQIPSHTHPLNASNAATSAGPSGQYFGAANQNLYVASAATLTMGDIVDPAGGSQPHSNMQPYQVVTYIIATEGIYPSQS